MKYYLIHMTYDIAPIWDDEILVRGDSKEIEACATRRRRHEMGAWQLGCERFASAGHVWRKIKKAIKNGVCCSEKSAIDGFQSRYEARELTEEEAAMILFQGERVSN